MKRLILPLIVGLAFTLRVFGLNDYPVGFTPDEASFGYDAYSLSKTGKDQWGHLFPLVLESFGDFKAPLYAYLTIPSVIFFGLSKFAVRLPNALIGTAAVYITYLLVRELRKLGDKKLEIGNPSTPLRMVSLPNHWKLEILAAALLAASPWHIMMSRGAFEANLTTFFLPLGVFLFLKGMKDSKYFSWATLAFGLNLFAYHSAKLITPLVILILVFVLRREIGKIPVKKVLPAVVMFGVFLALTVHTFSLGAGKRVQEVSVFRGALEEAAPARLAAINKGMPYLIARLVHNKYQVAARRFYNNYKTYFTAKFLFMKGAAEATYGMIPGRGVLYWFELPLLLGFFIAFLKKKDKIPFWLTAGWIVFAPVPASLSMGVGYAANRAVITLPAIQIAEAFGGVYLFDIIKRKLKGSYSGWLATGYIAVVLIFLLTFIKDYITSPLKTAPGMLYGNLEVAYWLKQNVKSEKVIISRKLSEPHIYVAFANKWDPEDYQEATLSWNYKKQGLGWVDQMPEYRLGNCIFENIEWDKDSNKSSYLVGRPDEFPETTSPVVIFNYPSGEPAIFVVNPTLTKYAYTIN